MANETIQQTPTLEELFAAGDRRAAEYEERRFQEDVSYDDFVRRVWGHVANRFTYTDIPAPYSPSEIVLEMSHDTLAFLANQQVSLRPSMNIDIIRINDTSIHVPPFILNNFMSMALLQIPHDLPIQQDTRHTPDLDLYSDKPVREFANEVWDNIPTLVPGFGLKKDERFYKRYSDGDESVQWIATETPLYYASLSRIKNQYPDHLRPLVVEVMRGKIDTLDYIQVQWAIPLDRAHQYMQPIWSIFISDRPQGEVLSTDTRTGPGVNAWARTRTDVKIGQPQGRKKQSRFDDVYFHTDPSQIAILKQKNECGPDFEMLSPGKQAVECMRMNQLGVRWWDMPRDDIDIVFTDKSNPPISDDSLNRIRKVMKQNALRGDYTHPTSLSTYQMDELRRRAKQSGGVENPYLTMQLLGLTQGRLAFPRLAHLSDKEYFAMVNGLPNCVEKSEDNDGLIPQEEDYWREYHLSVPYDYSDAYLSHTRFLPSFRPGFEVLGEGFKRHLRLPSHQRLLSNIELVHEVFTV